MVRKVRQRRVAGEEGGGGGGGGGGGKKKKRKRVDLRELNGYPPGVSTWEPESQIHDDLIDAYEAELDAASELEAEEAEEGEEGEEE